MEHFAPKTFLGCKKVLEMMKSHLKKYIQCYMYDSLYVAHI